MKRLLGFLSLIVLISALAGCSESPEEKKQKLTNEGFQAAYNYQFDRARDLFKQLGDLDPQSPMSYYGRGLIFEKQLQVYDALHVYMTLTNSNPGFADAWAGLWRIYTGLGMYRDAADAASGFVERVPNDPQAQYDLAEAMLNANTPGRVYSLADSAVALGADADLINVLRARALLAQGKRDEADSVYGRAMSGDTKSAAALAEAVSYVENLGLLDSAAALSRQAVKVSGDDISRTIDYFHFLIKHHYFFEARQAMATLKARNVSDIVLAVMGAQYYLARGLLSDASAASDSIGVAAGKTISARMYEIDVRGTYGDELTVSTDVEVLLNEMYHKDYDKGFVRLMNYILTMKMATLLRNSVILPRMKTVEAGLSARMDFQLVRLFLLYCSGRRAEFHKGEDTILRYRSREVPWITGLADIYADRTVRKPDSAAPLYTRALDTSRYYRPAFEHFVAMYRRGLQFKKAAALFEKYPQFADRYPALACLHGITLVEAGQVDSGVTVFTRSAGYVSGDYTLFDEMRQALRRQWDTSGMQKLVDWITARKVANPDLLVIAASLDNDLKDFQTANSVAQTGLGREPSNLDLRAEHARALYGLGKAQAAIDILEENLKGNSYHIPSNYWLSRILAEEGRDSSRAANLARRAVFDSHSAEVPWVNLAYVYMKVGRFDLARGEAEKASHSYAGEPIPLFMYGKALYLSKKGDKAKKQLQAAINHGLAGPDLQEAKTLLAKL